EAFQAPGRCRRHRGPALLAGGPVQDAARSHPRVEHDFNVELSIRLDWATKPVVRTASRLMVEDGGQALLRAPQPKPEGCQLPRATGRKEGLGCALGCARCQT